MNLRFLLVALFHSIKCLCYVPVIIPNGKALEYTMDGDVKVFHLIAESVKQEFAPGLFMNCWGYNGSSPGPVIEAVEGDKVRIYVTNCLPEYTTVHWHGILLPNGMDGVTGLTQPPIQPGETFVYEFTLKQNGTYMYHPHADEVVQIGMGLVGFFIIHPQIEDEPVDRDFCIMTQEWFLPQGAATPDPTAMDFNYFSFNGRVFPGTDPLLAKTHDRVRIRWANISMNNHPIHLHGYEFTVTRRGGGPIPKSAQYSEVTVDVIVGATVDFEFVADNPGDWALHCHKSHHLMNGMAHGLPNLIGANISEETVKKIRRHLPHFMPMGTTGMGMMYEMKMKRPPNFLPYGSPGPFGTLDMGGMFTVVKVRDENQMDDKWYPHPEGTVAHVIANDSRSASSRDSLQTPHQH